MIRQTVEYKDYNGNDAKEDLYFNLTKAEIIELEMASGGGLSGSLRRISELQDGRLLLKQFKQIIGLSYGTKTEDGRRFVKDPKELSAFMSSEVYSQFFMDLMTIDGRATEFIRGVLPQDVIDEVVSELEQADSAVEERDRQRMIDAGEIDAEGREIISREEYNTMSHNDRGAVVRKITSGKAVWKEDLEAAAAKPGLETAETN